MNLFHSIRLGCLLLQGTGAGAFLRTAFHLLAPVVAAASAVVPAAAALVADDKTHLQIWKSKQLDEWHWTFIPSGADEPYSGTAPTREQASYDIHQSEIHFLEVHGSLGPT